jgi:predicted transcriptional regulator
MKRAKLEMYIGILKILSQSSWFKNSTIACEANINCNELKKYLGFLLKQGLVDEQKVGKQRMVYSITQRGIAVLKYFKELKQEFPIIKEDTSS